MYNFYFLVKAKVCVYVCISPFLKNYWIAIDLWAQVKYPVSSHPKTTIKTNNSIQPLFLNKKKKKTQFTQATENDSWFDQRKSNRT